MGKRWYIFVAWTEKRGSGVVARRLACGWKSSPGIADWISEIGHFLPSNCDMAEILSTAETKRSIASHCLSVCHASLMLASHVYRGTLLQWCDRNIVDSERKVSKCKMKFACRLLYIMHHLWSFSFHRYIQCITSKNTCSCQHRFFLPCRILWSVRDRWVSWCSVTLPLNNLLNSIIAVLLGIKCLNY